MKNVYDLRYENNFLFLLPEKNHTESNSQPLKLYRKTAVIIYLYYLDTLQTYYPYLDNIPPQIDVYLISSREEVLREVKESWASRSGRKVHYILKENRGRDVSALLVTGREIVPKYEYVCFLHDKKEHCAERKEDTQFWVENLWRNQVGSSDYINHILDTFEKNKDLGILAPPEPVGKHFNTWYGYGWYHSFEITRELAKRLQLKADIRWDKPPITFGTVLWFRTCSLRKLFEAEWQYSDFNDEKLQRGHYLSYAIERIFAYVAQDAGYSTGIAMTPSYGEKQINFLQYSTHLIFQEMDSFFPINNLGDLECFQRNKGKVIEFARRNKEVYLYGAGKMGRLCSALLRAENILPLGFLVSKESEVTRIECLPVVPVDQLEDIQDMAVIITVYQREVQEEIAELLERYGCHMYIKLWAERKEW